MKENILQSALQDTVVYGDIKTHKAEIDTEDLSWILQILSTNLYSDPIGSLVREYSSNAWDANVEAGKKDKPIEVGLVTTSAKGSYFYVTDLGEGLSPEKINNVYRKFGKSTKRHSNEAIGMMGLGKFSGLSYSNEVYITTRVDCTEYEYLMHKSEGVPQIDLLYSKSTDLPSGTTITIYIKEYRDLSKFKEAISNQLAFFENVFFNVDGIDNNFKLLKGKTFTKSTLEDRSLRVKLGPVTYPIDWKVISHEVDDFEGLALNFEIGELAITPNRESLLYNKQTIENINKKIEEFKEEIYERYEAQLTEYTNIEDYVKALSYHTVFIDGENYTLTPSFFKNKKFKTARLKGLDLDLYLPNKALLFYGYKEVGKIENGRNSVIKANQSYRHSLYWPSLYTKVLYLEKEVLDAKKVKYICELHNSNSWKTIKRYKTKLQHDRSTSSWNRSNDDYFSILKLHTIPKAEWRKTIKKFQDWQIDYIKQNTISLDKNLPTKEWIKEQKATGIINNITNLRKSTGKILVRIASETTRWNVDGVFANIDKPIKNLGEEKKFIIYGTEDEKSLLLSLYGYIRHVKNIEIQLIAKLNHKYLNLLPNYININDFMKGNHKLFRKHVSLIKLAKIVEENAKIWECKALIEKLNTKDYNTIIKAKDLLRVNTIASKSDFADAALQLAEQNNFWDGNILEVINSIDKVAKKYAFVVHINTAKSYGHNKEYYQDVIEFTIEICKLKKLRLDLKHYVRKPEEPLQKEAA